MNKVLLKKNYFLLLFAFVALSSYFVLNAGKPDTINQHSEQNPEADNALQQAAVEALGKREGAIIVLDTQTGRIRALVNKEFAFGKAFSPGSTVKPFTALTALRLGLIKEDSTLLCRAPYKHDGFQIGCVHEKNVQPFDLVHALGHSCNFFFGKLGERINQKDFNSTFSSFGFGERTGTDEDEVAGTLPKGKWKSRIAIGETDELLVTPIQLVKAYTSLVTNKSVPPALAGGSSRYNPPANAGGTDLISNEHRALLIEGMRGAVEYGTAAKAELDELSLNIFGKTGTASGDGGYRMQGWFVGFAADAETKGRIPNPNEIKLAILVFIKGAHGADSAEISRQIFATFASLQIQNSTNIKQTANSEQRTADNSITVKVGRDGEVKTISLEEYVLGVLATESSFENELEALKAQAITTRTYALKHLQRHAKEGYDFCTLTHCQRYTSVNPSSVNGNLLRAVNETKGQVLRDANNALVEAYFSASCGGMTANLSDLWGVASKSYLKSFRDDYCAERPNSEWQATISNEKLLRALQADERTNIGNRLSQIRIVKRDSSLRANMLLLSGEREKQVRGWDFKIIVGRVLGWNLIKSSRFQIRRVGKDFVFNGSGFGHGLGLCQEGAHVMAARGFNHRQILTRYFPTTAVNIL